LNLIDLAEIHAAALGIEVQTLEVLLSGPAPLPWKRVAPPKRNKQKKRIKAPRKATAKA
jgi:hypothetical protein